MKANFPSGQLLFIRYDRFKSENLLVLEEVLNFLGLAPKQVPLRPTRSNVITYKTTLSEEMESKLRHWFKKDVEELESELGWDLSDWKA